MDNVSRKIHDIDFFLYTDAGNEIIPFDLKFTHISDAYFDLFSKGLTPLEAGHDDFLIGNGIEEIKEIKAYYSKRKAALSLPNYGSMSKKDLLDTLSKTGDPGAAGFIRAMDAVEEQNPVIHNISWKACEPCNFRKVRLPCRSDSVSYGYRRKKNNPAGS